MRFKSLARGLAAGVIAVGLALSSTAVAAVSAEPVNNLLSSSEEAQVRADFTKYGVPAVTQNKLINKFNRGELFDSLLGKAPISTEKSEDANRIVTVARFADGSVTVTKADKPGDGTKFGTIRECVRTGGSGYSNFTNCTIEQSWFVVAIAFVASYSIINGAPDRISFVGNQTQNCKGATCSNLRFTQNKRVEDSGGPATVQLQVSATTPVNSWEAWLLLEVGGDQGIVRNS